MRTVSYYSTRFQSEVMYYFACGSCLMSCKHGQYVRIGDTVITIDRIAALKLLKNEKISSIARMTKTAGATGMDFISNKKVG